MSVNRRLDGLASPVAVYLSNWLPECSLHVRMRPTVTQALLSGKSSLAMTVPLNRFLVLVAAALTLLTVMLATAYAVYAQSGDYSCAAGEAVVEPDNNPGLVSDCTALLAVIRLYFADGST